MWLSVKDTPAGIYCNLAARSRCNGKSTTAGLATKIASYNAGCTTVASTATLIFNKPSCGAALVAFTMREITRGVSGGNTIR